MTDSNTFNFQDYNQNQVIDFGTNEIQTGNEIDPSTYLQGDSAILQASAGLGETTTENVDYLNQNNFDTNAIFGETIKKINETPYGQNFQGTTTTTTGNIIDGNTLFSDNNGLITNTTTTEEVQGTTIDTNTFFNTANIDTNAIYGQTQILPTTTTATTTTTENTYYSQPQEIQGTTTYGETQILPSTDSNTYYDTAQITYDQPQTQTQNDYTTYQTSNTVDLNNYNFGTTNIETTNTYTTEAIPVTQNETTTTTTTNTYVEPTYETTQNYGITNTQTYQTSEIPVTTTTQTIFDTNEIPMTETKYLSPKPQYEVSQFQQTYDTTPITTTTTNVTTENIRTTNVVNQPIVETNYVPTSNQIITQPQVQNTRITTTTNQTIPENINNNQVTRVTNPPPQKNESKPQIIPINLNKNKGPSAYKILGNLIDEDFKRGRPIYTEYGSPYVKLRHYDQVSPTYQVRGVMNDNRHVIGLSRLTPALSYDRVGNNPPTLTSTLLKSNTNQIYPYNSNINNIRQDMNLINNNTGLDRITKATSYDAGKKSIDPLLNNYGFNQIKF